MSDQIVEHELQQIVALLPDTRWIAFVSVDGLVHRKYRFDSRNIRYDSGEAREEDRTGPVSGATSSLSERIASEFLLGKLRSTVISGEAGTFFVLDVGDGEEWLIAFVVKGRPPIDETLKYFKDRDNLAHIIPYLDMK